MASLSMLLAPLLLDLGEHEAAAELLWSVLLGQGAQARREKDEAARKETACLFQIPGFLLGMPLYDPYQCCGYVLQRLKTDGFVVSYMHPNTVRIDWSRHLIEGHVQRLEAHDAAEE